MGFQSYITNILLLRSGGGGVGGGGVEKWRVKLTSAKVEVEAELGNILHHPRQSNQSDRVPRSPLRLRYSSET